MPLEDCVKAQQKMKGFFNRGRTFTISERLKLNNNTYIYWLKENGQKNKKQVFKARTICIEKSIC